MAATITVENAVKDETYDAVGIEEVEDNSVEEPAGAEGDTTWQESWTYELDAANKTITGADHTIALTAYTGSASEITVPATAIIDGVTYQVYFSRIGNSGIATTLTVEDGVAISSLSSIATGVHNLIIGDVIQLSLCNAFSC